MRKILMFLCCAFAINGAWGARDCPATREITLDGLQNGNDDEFIYTNKDVYDEVRACNESKRLGGTKCNITKGAVYECDNESGCFNGTRLLAKTGWVTKKGNSVENTILECAVGFQDMWNQYTYSECSDDKFEDGKINFENDSSAECRKVGAYGYCCFTGEHFACLKAAKLGDPAAWNVNGSCGCTNVKNGDTDQYTWDGKKGRCVRIPSKPTQPTPVRPVPNPNPAPQPTPVNPTPTPVSPTPNPTPVVVSPVVEPSFECPEITPSDWRTKYADCTDVINGYESLISYCAGTPNRELYNNKWMFLQVHVRQCEQEASSNSSNNITDLSGKFKDILNIKPNVWKNADGNFNTARLASDSIAGVVLGTAGGLITSHLVKKGQVKTGFEDIQCTVGGQKVADWADEFTVGIR